MQSAEIRQKFLDFFKERGHTVIPSSSLVPAGDSSVLFTTAGMQQFKPYYIGKADAQKDFGALNTASAQKCVRTSDIEAVGDESHLTFFEMLGNFSFGDYWKKEAIEYAHEFITKDMGLQIDFVSVFGGEAGVPEDKESAEIWQSIDSNIIIKKFSRKDNFWGPTGVEGPCGPTTEIYVEGIEIWNIVFNEYYSAKGGPASGGQNILQPLKVKGVDTGMGLERLVKVIQKVPTVFETDLFESIMQVVNSRIVADHIRTAVFMIADGVTPSNTDRGYILRRLLRRAYVKHNNLAPVIEVIMRHPSYDGIYTFNPETNKIISEELNKFKKTLDTGLKQVENGADPFTLFTTYGLPLEIIVEVTPVDKAKFEKQMAEHRQLSSLAGENKFKK